MITFNESMLLKLISRFPFRNKTYYQLSLAEDNFQLPLITGHDIDKLEYLGLIENDVTSLFLSKRGEIELNKAMKYFKNKAEFLFEDTKQ